MTPYSVGGQQILVQLPGVDDVARAREIIRSTSFLEIKIVEDGPAPSREALLQARNGVLPPDMELATSRSDVLEGGGVGDTQYYLVRRVAAVTGQDLRNARVGLDEFNQPAVSFTFNREGARKFGDVTGENIGRLLAVLLDDQIQTVATIISRITDEGQITGSFTQQRAADLALVLRSGALPASLDYLEERTIGPTLGADSVRAGVAASLSGLAAVAVFMLVYYKLAGINAIVAVVLNLLILMGLMAYIDAVLTLPGIAGLILIIGIGVDSNVLIFERIKEELRAGKPARSAMNAGFDRVFLTIVDTHIASLIAAAFLFNFGSGPIKGFATTLAIGLVSNVFTAVFVSRTMFEAILARRRSPTAEYLDVSVFRTPQFRLHRQAVVRHRVVGAAHSRWPRGVGGGRRATPGNRFLGRHADRARVRPANDGGHGPGCPIRGRGEGRPNVWRFGWRNPDPIAPVRSRAGVESRGRRGNGCLDSRVEWPR